MNTLRSARAPFALALLLNIVGLLLTAGAAHAGGPPTPRDLHIMTACRVYDSRITGGPLASGAVRDITLGAGCALPDDAASVIVNLTAVNPTSAGYLQIYQGGTAPPTANALTFEAGDILGQLFVVKLGTAPSPDIHVQPTMGAGQTTHFVIDVLAFNGSGAPSDIALDNASVQENQPAGTLVGNLSTIDPDFDDTHTYSLVSGTGSTDNAKFQISGSQLQTSTPLDRKEQLTYSIRVRSTDNFGVFFEEVFTITAGNENEPPVIIAGGVLNYTESDPPTAIDANLTVTDDSTNLQSATVQITGGFQSSEDVLSFVNTPNITAGAFDTGTGTLTLTGTDTVANWQTALRSVRYNNTSENPSTAARTVTWIATDDGSLSSTPVTSTINVASTNTQPTITTIDDQLINEDSSTGALAFTVGDAETAAASLIVTGLSSNTSIIPNANIVLGGSGASRTVTVTPAANANGGPVTITITVDDGSAAPNATVSETFDVTVTSVNDEPTLDPIPDPADILEDAGLQTVNLTGIGAGGAGTESAQILTVTAVSDNPGLIPNPTVVYTSPNATGSLQYTPVANQSGTAIITVTVQDDGGIANGGDDTIQRTFTVDVLAVNGEPTLDPIPDPADINEDAGLQTVSLTGISAGDGGSESGQTLTVTALSSNPGLIPNPTVIYTSPNATGSLQYTPVANQFGTAIITVTVQDDGGTANGGDDTIQRTFTVDVLSRNDEPTLDPIPDPADINEDAGLQTVSLTGISAGGAGTESGQTLTVTAVSDNPGLIPNPTVIYTSPNATGSLQYTPVANQSGTAIITVTVQDDGGTANGGDDTIQRTFTVDVLSRNDEPTLDPIADPADILEDAGLQTVSLTGIGPGGAGSESGQTLTVTALSSNPGLIPHPTVIYTSPNATGSLQYTPVANQSGTAIITVTVQDDGGTANGGDDTIQRTFTVDVLAVNDEPTLDPIPDPADILEDAGLQTVNLTGISAGGGESQILTVTALSSNPGLIPHPTVVYTSPNATGSLQYTPVANQFGTAIITVTVQDNGGTANGGDDTIQRTFTVDVLAVNDPPIFADAMLDYTTAGNTQLRGGDLTPGASVAHVRDNLDLAEKSVPSDIDGPAPPFTFSLAVAPANGQATVHPNGTFTYEPNPGFHGPTDTFTVAVSDGGTLPNTSNLTITVTITEMVWYVRDVVDGDNPEPGDDGRSTNAFEVLGDVEPVLTDNDFIFVFEGNTGVTPLNGGIDIDNTGVKLHGQGHGLTVPGVGTLIPAGNRPRITNVGAAGAPEDNGVNVIATGASLTGIEIRGLNISGRDNAIDVTATGAHSAGVTISDNTISNDPANGLEGIDVNAGSTGTVTVALHDNTLTARGNAFDFQRTLGTAVISAFHDNVVTAASAGAGLVVTGTGGVVTFDASPTAGIQPVPGGTTVIGTPGDRIGGPGLSLSNVTGVLSFANAESGPIAAGDLDIFTDSGTALNVAGGAGGFDFDVTPNAGVLAANAGPAAVISGADVSLQLNSLTSTTSTSGVSLTTVSGTFSAPSGSSITKGSGGGTAFSIDNSAAGTTVLTSTYAGTINNSSSTGRSVSINSADSGSSVSFSGQVTDTGLGVSLTTNTGATISFNGGLTASTGANTAFSATGGGTIQVCDDNPCNPGATGLLVNTLTTTTATALNVVSTAIGSNRLEFRSISSSGGGNSGIVLNSTCGGAACNTSPGFGGLTVTGNGGSCTSAATCSGGAIQTKSVNGISLTNTRSVSLTRMFIDNNDGSGIFGDDVTDFSLINSTVTNNADTSGGVESGLRFNELLGNCAITNSTISGSSEDDIRLTPTSGVLTNLAISGSTIGPSPSPTGQDGFHVEASGTANITLNVTSTTFRNLRVGGMFVATSGTATANATVNGNFFRDNGSHVQFTANNDSDITFNVSSNTEMLRSQIAPIQVLSASNTSNASQIRGTISGNVIGNGTIDSGAREGNNAFGVAVDLRGRGDTILAINSNNIRNTDFEGIWVSSAYFCTSGCPAGSPGRLDVTIRDNSVQNIDDNSIAPRLDIRGVLVDGRHETTVCLDMAGNTSTGSPGIEHFRVRQRDTSIFHIERMSDGDATPNELINSAATVEADVAADNDPGSTADATLVLGFTEAANGFCRKP